MFTSAYMLLEVRCQFVVVAPKSAAVVPEQTRSAVVPTDTIVGGF